MPLMKFTEAIQDAYVQSMRADPKVFLLGVGIIDPKAVFGTVKGLRDEFGDDRFVEGPLAEQMLTGFAFGAATAGLRPVLIHHRVDFLPLTMDQIVSHAAKWRYMFGNQMSVPMVIRGIVGRGWGNGPQHTQSLHGLMSQVPGLQVLVPSNAADAKGLMVAAMKSNDPVIYIDHRWLHEDSCEVPSGLYEVPIGKARIVHQGNDVTIVSIGPLVQESMKMIDKIKHRVSVELIDLRSARPIDYDCIYKSVQKTGRLIVADPDWEGGGVAASVISHVSQNLFQSLKSAPISVMWPSHPVPASFVIEANYYPMEKEILSAVERIMSSRFEVNTDEKSNSKMQGPF